MTKPEQVNPFNTQFPAGEYFAGRERQLAQLSERLDALASGVSSNICVIGRGGEGKTSFLEKAVTEAKARGFIACRASLDVAKPAETNIDTIVRRLLREIETATKQRQLEADWASGQKSSFRTPKHAEIRSDELELDFVRILELLPRDHGPTACVVCIDEGHRIHPIALTALKNALQPVKSGYMFILSLLNQTPNSNNEAAQEMLDELAARSGDPGASRFFKYNSISLGPFDTLAEAEECVQKRLHNNVTGFAPEVINIVSRSTGRYPAGIIAFSHAIYEQAKEKKESIATVSSAHEAFLSKYRAEVAEAVTLIGQLSDSQKKICRIALSLDTRFTALQVAQMIAAESGSALAPDYLLVAVESTLKMLDVAGLHNDAGDYFAFSNPLQAYSLRLALECP